MLKGGYQILNLIDFNIKIDDELTIPNIYKKLKNTPKTILVSGLTIDGITLRDVYASPKLNNDNIELVVGEYNILIKPNDSIIITENKPNSTEPLVVRIDSTYSALTEDEANKITNAIDNKTPIQLVLLADFFDNDEGITTNYKDVICNQIGYEGELPVFAGILRNSLEEYHLSAIRILHPEYNDEDGWAINSFIYY